VWVEYEDLPHGGRPGHATAPRRAALCDGAPDNIAAEMRTATRPSRRRPSPGARHVVKLDIVNQRVAALSIEPRSVLAWVADDGRLTLRMSTQMPSGVRNSLCDVLGLPRASRCA
jgi:carbon-monoxide dehydrogenase large subunit